MTPKHEIKTCPRCKMPFECKAGDIAHCHCNNLQLSEAAQKYIALQFTDCLCHQCLQELNHPAHLFLNKKNLFNQR